MRHRSALGCAALCAVCTVATATKAKSEWWQGGVGPLGEVRYFGVQADGTAVRNPSSRATDAGTQVGFWMLEDAVFRKPKAVVRFLAFGSIGAAYHGIAGSLGSEAAIGLRLPVGNYDTYSGEPGVHVPHSFFARIAYAAHLLGNRTYYSSGFQFPRLEVGYAESDEGGLELRLHAGHVLFGRFDTSEASRGFNGGAAWGARVLYSPWTSARKSGVPWAELGFERLDPRGFLARTSLGASTEATPPGPPTDIVDGKLFFRTRPVGLFVTTRIERGVLRGADGHEHDVLALYQGIGLQLVDRD